MRNTVRILASLLLAFLLAVPIGAAQSPDDRAKEPRYQPEPYQPDCHDGYCPPPECHGDHECPKPTACTPDEGCAHDGRHPEPAYPDEYPEECRAQDEERRAASERLHEEFRKRWDALAEERRAYYSKGNHTPEDDKAFESSMGERERDLRYEMDEAFRHLEEKYRDQGPCGPRMAHGGETMPAECDWSYMEQAIREFEDRLRQEEEKFFLLQEEKWRKLESRMEEQRRAYESKGNHSEQDRADFETRMRNEWRQAEGRIHEEERAFFQKQEAQRENFRLEQEGRCHGGDGGHEMRRAPPPGGMEGRHPGRGPGPHGFDAAHEEMEIQRFECQLKVKMRMTEVMRQMDEAYRRHESSGTHPSRAEMEELEIKRLEAEIEVRKAMLECERMIRDKWDSQIRTELEEARPHERMGSWSMSEDPQTGEVHLRGKFMTVKGDTNTNTLKEVTVTGQVWISGIATDSYFDEEEWNMGDGGHGSWLKGAGPGVAMRLHDNPSGLIRFKADEGYSFLVTVPDYVEVSPAPNGFTLTSNGGSALIRAHHDQASWDAASAILSLSGDAEFLVPDSSKNYVLEKVANKHREAITGAVEDRHLGAEITFTTDDEGSVIDETLVYEDVEVLISEPEAEGTVEVILSSDTLDAGKTFVLNLDSRIVSVEGSIDVRYADIDEETGEETPVGIHKASSLSDVLDATDDDGPEYWIVMDEDGYQVLVSVPHWSTHKITVQGSEADPASVPAPGLGLVGLTALLAAVYVVRRRRA